jgi:transcriptional regulator with XRE-family HTH domain
MHGDAIAPPRYAIHMDISKIRHDNLDALISQYGSIEAVATAADVSASYLSQIKNGTRGMGSRFARKLEAALSLPNGWFDQIGVTRPDAGQAAPIELALFRKLSRAQREAIVVILRAMTRD